MNLKLNSGGSTQLTLTSAQSLAFASTGTVNVYLVTVAPNQPAVRGSTAVATVTNGLGSYAPAAAVTVLIEVQFGYEALYDYGTQPFVRDYIGSKFSQPVPGTLNATGALTMALVGTGIVTSSTAAGVAATLDTGTVCDASGQWQIGDSFEWAVINTGPSTFTLTAAAGHTIVGVATILTLVSSIMITKKTAANTFVTYKKAG